MPLLFEIASTIISGILEAGNLSLVIYIANSTIYIIGISMPT